MNTKERLTAALEHRFDAVLLLQENKAAKTAELIACGISSGTAAVLRRAVQEGIKDPHKYKEADLRKMVETPPRRRRHAPAQVSARTAQVKQETNPLKGLQTYLMGVLPFLLQTDIAELVITPVKNAEGAPVLKFTIARDQRVYESGELRT